jgi:hypothetical protein
MYSVEGRGGTTSSADQFPLRVFPAPGRFDCSRGPPNTPAAKLFVDCTTAALATAWGTALPFQSDSVGSPSRLTFSQVRGKLKFGWVDHSLCEEAWAMTRAGQPFVADYYEVGDSPCGVYHNRPTDMYDDLTLPLPGREGKREPGHTEQ